MIEKTAIVMGATQYWRMSDIKTATFNEMRREVLALAETGNVAAHYLIMEAFEEAFRRGVESQAESRN